MIQSCVRAMVDYSKECSQSEHMFMKIAIKQGELRKVSSGGEWFHCAQLSINLRSFRTLSCQAIEDWASPAKI